MNTPVGLEHCLSFINCNLQPPTNPTRYFAGDEAKRAVTISRQSGCGAHAVAEKLAARLQTVVLPGAPPWMVYDRNLVEKVLVDHHLPGHLARFMPEDHVSAINDTMDQLFGLHPPLETLVQQTSETILRLAERGNVIILGRGANFLTAGRPHVLHVRMVASLERRIENMQHFENLSRKEATDRIHREDLGRQRYLKRHFDKDINDPLLYHLVINTDWVALEDAARLIADLVLNRTVAAPVQIAS
jgi:cytidylate kinase